VLPCGARSLPPSRRPTALEDGAIAGLSAGETLLLLPRDMKEEAMLQPMSNDALAPDAPSILGRTSGIGEP